MSRIDVPGIRCQIVTIGRFAAVPRWLPPRTYPGQIRRPIVASCGSTCQRPRSRRRARRGRVRLRGRRSVSRCGRPPPAQCASSPATTADGGWATGRPSPPWPRPGCGSPLPMSRRSVRLPPWRTRSSAPLPRRPSWRSRRPRRRSPASPCGGERPFETPGCARTSGIARWGRAPRLAFRRHPVARPRPASRRPRSHEQPTTPPQANPSPQCPRLARCSATRLRCPAGHRRDCPQL